MSWIWSLVFGFFAALFRHLLERKEEGIEAAKDPRSDEFFKRKRM